MSIVTEPYEPKHDDEYDATIRCSCPDCGWTARVPGYIRPNVLGGVMMRCAEPMPSHPEPNTCSGTEDWGAEFVGQLYTTTPGYNFKMTL